MCPLLPDVRYIACPQTGSTVVHFRKNLFSGTAEKNFVREMARVVNFWNDKSSGLSSIIIENSYVHACFVATKTTLPFDLSLWNDGDFDQLIREARAIQTRMIQNRKETSMEQLSKTFVKHMLRGKINAALRLLENSPNGGVLELNDDVISDLKKMHPS